VPFIRTFFLRIIAKIIDSDAAGKAFRKKRSSLCPELCLLTIKESIFCKLFLWKQLVI